MKDFPRQLSDRFRPQRLLGAGAMGRVYLATDLELDRDVAIKLLLDAGRPELRRRFWREVESLAKVRHRNVMQVFDWGMAGDDPFLVIEYLEGRSLEQGRVRDPERVTLELAAALDEVHRVGLVHRDLKPANVMRCRDGRVVLTDFGLVRDLERANLTATGQVVGSLGFLAPEVLRGTRGTAAADWFALGVTLFLLVEGRLPVTSADVMEIAKGAPYPTPEFQRVPPDGPLAAVVRALIQEAPEDRAASRQALEWLFEGPSATTPPAATPGEAPAAASWPADAPVESAAATAPGEGSQVFPLTRSLEPLRPRPRPAAALGLLVVTLGAAYLLRVGASDPVPAPRPVTPSGTPPTTDPGPLALPEDYPSRVRAELEATAELMVLPDETLAPLPDGTPPEDWRPLLDGDPLRFRLALGRLPELGRFFAFQAAGGRGEELPGRLVDALRGCDAWYQRRGLLGPFGPYLDPPGEGPVTPPSHFLEDPWPPEVRAPSGWLAEVLRALAGAREFLAARKQELPHLASRLAESEPDAAAVFAVHTLRRRRTSLLAVVPELFRDPATRRFVAAWLRPGQAHLQRLFHAAARAAARGGAPAEAAACLAGIAGKDLRLLFYGLPAYLPLEALLGPEPTTATGWAVRSSLMVARLEVQGQATGAPLRDETNRLYQAAWPRALEEGDAAPAVAAPRIVDVLATALRELRRADAHQDFAEAWRRHRARVRELGAPAQTVWLELLQAWNAGDLPLERPDLERMLQVLSEHVGPSARLLDLATQGGYSRLQRRLQDGGDG